VSHVAAGRRSARPSDHPSRARLLRDVGHGKLEAACHALDRRDLIALSVELFDTFADSWGDWEPQYAPAWASDITDDGSPFELSVAFGGKQPELRILAERQRRALNAESNWQSGLELNTHIAQRYGAHLAEFERVRELFVPRSEVCVRFSMWHAAVLRTATEAPAFKIYVNPQVRGADAARGLCERALLRLGFDAAAEQLALADRGSQFVYFSLDLSAHDARVKVYTAHPGKDARDVEHAVERMTGHVPGGPGALASVIEALIGSRGALTQRAVQTCFAYRAGVEQPEVTTYVPMRAYVDDDADAIARAARLMRRQDAERLRDIAHAVAERPLELGRGLLTYIGVREHRDHRRITAYLSPQVYAIASPRRRAASGTYAAAMPASSIADQEALSYPDMQRILATWQSQLVEHSFMKLLDREATFEQVLRVAPRVAFFVMCFQDVLRLVYERTSDPALKALACTHEREDRGHDLWYLQDLDQLGVHCDVRDLFARDTRPIRDIAFRQIADALDTRDDRARLGIVLSLEAAGSVFFGRMIACLERLDKGQGLLYFARKHQKVESEHNIFESGPDNILESIAIPGAVVPEFMQVVERTFATMLALADDLDACARGLHARSA